MRILLFSRLVKKCFQKRFYFEGLNSHDTHVVILKVGNGRLKRTLKLNSPTLLMIDVPRFGTESYNRGSNGKMLGQLKKTL